MRIGRRRLGAAVAGLLAVVVVGLALAAVLRWRAAGVAHAIAPPAGTVTASGDGGGYPREVVDRAGIIARSLRSDRGKATVRIYPVAPGSPWLRARQTVATQLDHWEQLGDCADNERASIVECAWREPTRWWPREVVLTMVRLPAAGDEGAGRPGAGFVIVGSGLG